MTKDRLLEMRKFIVISDTEDSEANSQPDEKSKLIDDLCEKIGSIRLEVQRIKNRIGILRRFHEQIQKCTSLNVRKELEEKVEEESTIITTSASSIRSKLQSIEDLFSVQKMTPAMQRIKEVQINSLLTTLNETMQEYLKCLVDHREKCLELLKNMVEVKNDDNADVEQLLEEGKTALFVNNPQNIPMGYCKMNRCRSIFAPLPKNLYLKLLLESLDEKYRLEDVEARHREILNVEKSIRELRNLFKELAFSVATQGEKITNMNQYVVKSQRKVESARRDVEAARVKKTRCRKRKLIAGSVCLIIIIILLILLSLF